ncbi:MAG: lysophospholipid acyltransferase family protein [Pseudomonadota bacterium]
MDLLGWVRIACRLPLLSMVLFTGLACLLIVRVLEKPLFGLDRPWTPILVQGVCKAALAIIGLSVTRHGTPMRLRGGMVANHGSWLDIFVLNAGARVYFVSKEEVAQWPGIGWLARATGTLFIARKAQGARDQRALFEARLLAGNKLLFFPEGTSSDSLRVLPFKSTLFAAFLSEGLRETNWVQPVTVIYSAPQGGDRRFYGWWGDMAFGPHLLKLLAARKHGSVTVHYHAPLKASEFHDRKALAEVCEGIVRSVFPSQAELQS